MAKQIITRITDDLTGEVADETVEFSVDGTQYQIDLSSAHAKELREFLARYQQAGTRVARSGFGAPHSFRRSPQKPTVAATRAQNQAIRSWATANGFGEINGRGRIPQRIVDAFNSNTPATPVSQEPEPEQVAEVAPARKRAAPRKVAAVNFKAERVKR